MKLADLMYRSITGESPIQRDFLVDVNWTHDYPTRRGNQLKFPPIKHESDKNFFLYNLVKIWNSLAIADDAHKFRSLSSFQKACKLEILDI